MAASATPEALQALPREFLTPWDAAGHRAAERIIVPMLGLRSRNKADQWRRLCAIEIAGGGSALTRPWIGRAPFISRAIRFCDWLPSRLWTESSRPMPDRSRFSSATARLQSDTMHCGRCGGAMQSVTSRRHHCLPAVTTKSERSRPMRWARTSLRRSLHSCEPSGAAARLCMASHLVCGCGGAPVR